MLIFLILGYSTPLLLLTLALALYLTVIELREIRPNYGWWIWWLLLVFMTHFVGYIALRIYSFLGRHRGAE